MAIGNQLTQQAINNLVSSMTVALRNDMQQIMNFNQWLSAIGGATYLESLSFAASDAAAIVAMFGNLAALANTYQTNVLYMANTEPAWAGI
jgi:hypothetical protein